MKGKKRAGFAALCLICAMLFLNIGSVYTEAAELVPENRIEIEESSEAPKPETETERQTESDSKKESQTETESSIQNGGGAASSESGETETNSQPETENDSKKEPETEAGSTELDQKKEPETETEKKPENDSEAVSETEIGSESEPESGTKMGSETEMESGTEVEAESETETESESETESAVLTEYWQDMTMMKFGTNPNSRVAKPVIKRDDSLIMGYLEYPCYFKYATKHGMDVGGKTVAAYCVYNTLEAPENAPYKPSAGGSFSKEITYCLYNGCRYRGSTAYNSAYSTGNWKKDYYITQVAIHLINNEQGRESSITKQIDTKKAPAIWKLICKMKDDAYADSGQISNVNNQSMEVSYQVSPETQSDWVQQKDGSWRTQADYTAKSNHPDRLTKASWKLEENTPAGVQLAVKDTADPLSPFWFTATDAAYRNIGRNHLTLAASVQVSCTEYGGWWYVPADSSLKRQYITFLSQEETEMVSNQTRRVTATSKEQYFRVSLRKKDAANSAGLANAVYGLYSDPAASVLVASFPPTDANGMTALEQLSMTQDLYYVKEITPPKGYCRDQTVYPVNPVQNPDTQIECPDKEQKSMLRIYKEGELLTGAEISENGVNFRYETKGLAGAVFDLYAAEVIKNARGQVVYEKDALAAGNLTTGADGYAQSGALTPGRYYLKEKSAPQFMVSDGEPKPVMLSAGDELTEVKVTGVTVRNQRQKLELRVVKKDAETKNGVAGACFGVFADQEIKGSAGETLVQAGTLLGKARSDESGRAVFQTDLPCGNAYVVKELEAPEGYVLDPSWNYAVLFENHPEKAVQELEAECPEQRFRGTLQLLKVDSETKEPVPQGDAVLEGAQYGLYARKDIVHPDGHTGILYHAGEQAAVLTVDQNGKAQVEDLYPGAYYLKELAAPEGYVKDETEYELVFPGRPEENGAEASAVILKTVILEEQVKKQPFQLLKVSNTGVTNPKPLAGAGFTAWLLSELHQNEDGSYNMEQAEPVILGMSGETELFTDENGYLCTIPLAYGTYLVRETTVPAEHKPVKEFFVTVSEHKPEEPQPWRVFLDDAFDARLKIVKKDSSSGESVLIPGAEFRIWDYAAEAYVEQKTTYPESGLHDSFFTNETGSLILPEPLSAGKYRIEEVSAPEGYLVNHETIDVTISSDMVYHVDSLTGDPILVYEVEDQPALGVIELRKSGEQLVKWENDFSYEKHPLAGVSFGVYAKEDIYTPDGQKEADGTRKILYPKGTKAAVITTDETGYGVTEPLPLGLYQLLEQETPEGFLPDPEGVEVRLESKDQETAVTAVQIEVENIRRRVEIRVKKVDKETKETLAGGKFGLYAKEDIKNRKGETVIRADQQLAICVTDENGIGVFEQDLPVGAYYVKEEQAPEGYVNSYEMQEIDFRITEKVSDQNAENNGSKVQTETLTFENVRTTTEFHKTDFVDSAEIPGAGLTLFDQDGKVVDKWISGEEPHTIRGLKPGSTYTLREETAPFGYIIAEDAVFTVADSDEIQKVTMQDRHAMGRLVIEKQDKKNKKALKGAVFELRTKDGEVLEELVTDENGKAESGLYEIGSFSNGKMEKEIEYYLAETKAPKGYQMDETIYKIHFPYQDAHTEIIEVKQKVVNERKPAPEKASPNVPKTGDQTPWGIYTACLLLSGAAFAVLRAGKTRKKKGTL